MKNKAYEQTEAYLGWTFVCNFLNRYCQTDSGCNSCRGWRSRGWRVSRFTGQRVGGERVGRGTITIIDFDFIRPVIDVTEEPSSLVWWPGCRRDTIKPVESRFGENEMVCEWH